MADYIIQKDKTQVAVFYNPKSNYSKSLKEKLFQTFDQNVVKIIREIDLPKQIFNAKTEIENITKIEMQALVFSQMTNLMPILFLIP